MSHMDLQEQEARFARHSFVSDVECFREDGVVKCRVEVNSANAVGEMFRKVLNDDDRIEDSDIVEREVLVRPGQSEGADADAT